MKQAIHPPCGLVIFRDPSADAWFPTHTTIVGRLGEGRPTGAVCGDKVVCPVGGVDVSNANHPFWTGRRRDVDNEGRVEQFNRRHGARHGVAR